MLSELVKLEDVVEVTIVQENSEGVSLKDTGKTYRTKVFDILSEDQLEIVMPMEKGKLLLLPADAQIRLCFYAEKGLFQCQGRILDRYKSNNIYILAAQVTSSLQRAQRREFYRLGCAINVEFRMLEQAEINSVEHGGFRILKGKPLQSGIVVDISGGGMRFVADCGYPAGTLIYCTYTLLVKNEEKQYELAGKVMRSQEIKNRPGEFENRIQYVNLDVDDREEIIKFIFEEERRQRHKAVSR